MSAGIVIIGGGQAAGWAAKTLRDGGYDQRISVVADEPWDFYERPPLSKSVLLQDEVALTRLFSEPVQAALDLSWYRPLRAEQILRGQKRVLLSDGQQLAYDRLLIATGSRPRLPGARVAEPSPYSQLTQLAGRHLAESRAQRLSAPGGGWRRLDWIRNCRFCPQQRYCRHAV